MDGENELWANYWTTKSIQDRNKLFDKYIGWAQELSERVIAKRKLPIHADEALSLVSMGLIRSIQLYEPETHGEFENYAYKHVAGSTVEAAASLDMLSRKFRKRERQQGDEPLKVEPIDQVSHENFVNNEVEENKETQELAEHIIKKCMRVLEPDEFVMFYLYYVCQQKTREIGRIFKLDNSTTWRTIKNSLELVKEMFPDRP